MAEDERGYLIQRPGTRSAPTLIDVLTDLTELELGETATVFKRGVKNNDPECVATVSRVLDGWVVTNSARPEAAWVTAMRELLSQTQDL